MTPELRGRSADAILSNPLLRSTAVGRVGDSVYRVVDGMQTVEYRPKQRRTRPSTEREAANAALQERIKQAYDALDPKHVAAWRSYASTLRKPRRRSEGGGWKKPQPFQLFRKAMGERWREDPNASVMRYPFEPTAPAWHGDGI